MKVKVKLPIFYKFNQNDQNHREKLSANAQNQGVSLTTASVIQKGKLVGLNASVLTVGTI